MHEIIATAYFLLPAAIANGSPMLASRTPFLREILVVPLDGGLRFLGKPIWGENKTLRGALVMIGVAFLAVFIQKHLLNTWLDTYAIIDYDSSRIFLYGFIFGFGALAGDLLGSFCKRRLGFKPGQWFPYIDQVDWVAGVFVLLLLFSFLPPFEIIILAFTVIPFLTLAGSCVAVKLGIKSSI